MGVPRRSEDEEHQYLSLLDDQHTEDERGTNNRRKIQKQKSVSYENLATLRRAASLAKLSEQSDDGYLETVSLCSRTLDPDYENFEMTIVQSTDRKATDAVDSKPPEPATRPVDNTDRPGVTPNTARPTEPAEPAEPAEPTEPAEPAAVNRYAQQIVQYDETNGRKRQTTTPV